jgi:hypothetical protein
MSLTQSIRLRLRGAEGAMVWAAMALLVAHASVLTARGHQEWVKLASNSLQILASGLAFVACLQARRRSDRFGRSFWIVSAFGFLFWMMSQSLWTYKELVFGQIPRMEFTDVMFFFAYAPFAMVLLMDSESEKEQGLDWQRTLDVLQVLIVVFCAYLYLFYVPSKWETQMESMNRIVDEVFLWRNVILSLALWVRAFFSSTRMHRSLFRQLAIFMTCYALLTRLSNFARVHWEIGTGSWYDMGWTLPFAIGIISISMWRPPQEEEKPFEKRSGVRRLLALHLAPTLIPALVLYMGANIAAEQLAIASIAIIASFTCYSLRLWVTQYRQQQTVEALR